MSNPLVYDQIGNDISLSLSCTNVSTLIRETKRVEMKVNIIPTKH